MARVPICKALAVVVLAAASAFAHAQPVSREQLAKAFDLARGHDAQYLSALAELDVNKIGARIASTAFYPTLQVSDAQSEIETARRRTITLSQPILSADKYASYKEAEPREQLAQATFLAREQDLALRLFRAIAELTRASEGIETNKARVLALQQQASAAKRSFDLGQGTITDLRDTQVRLDQAQATDLAVKARRSAALRLYASIVGQPLGPNAFNLAREKRDIKLLGTNEYVPVALQINPQVVTARANARIGELGVIRARGAVLPSVSINFTDTRLALGPSSTYTGVFLSFPIQAGGILNMSSASANEARVKELVRDAEQQVRLDVERLLSVVEAGRAESEIRLDTIRSAELSVTANEKSFAGGVRTNIDVLNAIQTLAQTKDDYVNSVLTLAENLLTLRLRLAVPARDALVEVSSLLF